MRLLNTFLLSVVAVNSFKTKPCMLRNLHQTKIYSKKEKTRFSEYLYKPKNPNQEKYLQYLHDDNVKIVVSVGPAGTGKTMFACIKAIQSLKSGSFNKIVITRPIVAVEEEELGFLPGNLVKKMDPWTRPIMDIFMEFYSKTEIDNMIYSNVIEISPLAYMRGRTFKNAFIIADEMQNSSPNQMLMLTTRIGTSSKLIITGDLKQTDRKTENNGLFDLINKIKTYKQANKNETLMEIIEFCKNDVERSIIVQKMIDIYQFESIESSYGDTFNKSEDKQFDSTAFPYKETFTKDGNNNNNNNSNSFLKNKNRDDDAALMPRNDIFKYSKYSKIFNL
jgi:phosphate starvation-inducible PhoH-like protein